MGSGESTNEAKADGKEPEIHELILELMIHARQCVEELCRRKVEFNVVSAGYNCWRWARSTLTNACSEQQLYQLGMKGRLDREENWCQKAYEEALDADKT